MSHGSSFDIVEEEQQLSSPFRSESPHAEDVVKTMGGAEPGSPATTTSTTSEVTETEDAKENQESVEVSAPPERSDEGSSSVIEAASRAGETTTEERSDEDEKKDENNTSMTSTLTSQEDSPMAAPSPGKADVRRSIAIGRSELTRSRQKAHSGMGATSSMMPTNRSPSSRKLLSASSHCPPTRSAVARSNSGDLDNIANPGGAPAPPRRMMSSRGFTVDSEHKGLRKTTSFESNSRHSSGAGSLATPKRRTSKKLNMDDISKLNKASKDLDVFCTPRRSKSDTKKLRVDVKRMMDDAAQDGDFDMTKSPGRRRLPARSMSSRSCDPTSSAQGRTAIRSSIHRPKTKRTDDFTNVAASNSNEVPKTSEEAITATPVTNEESSRGTGTPTSDFEIVPSDHMPFESNKEDETIFSAHADDQTAKATEGKSSIIPPQTQKAGEEIPEMNGDGASSIDHADERPFFDADVRPNETPADENSENISPLQNSADHSEQNEVSEQLSQLSWANSAPGDESSQLSGAHSTPGNESLHLSGIHSTNENNESSQLSASHSVPPHESTGLTASWRDSALNQSAQTKIKSDQGSQATFREDGDSHTLDASQDLFARDVPSGKGPWECATCQYPNRDRNHLFCGMCGTGRDWCCPSCDTENASSSKFCGTCGTKKGWSSALKSKVEQEKTQKTTLPKKKVSRSSERPRASSRSVSPGGRSKTNHKLTSKKSEAERKERKPRASIKGTTDEDRRHEKHLGRGRSKVHEVSKHESTNSARKSSRRDKEEQKLRPRSRSSQRGGNEGRKHKAEGKLKPERRSPDSSSVTPAETRRSKERGQPRNASKERDYGKTGIGSPQRKRSSSLTRTDGGDGGLLVGWKQSDDMLNNFNANSTEHKRRESTSRMAGVLATPSIKKRLLKMGKFGGKKPTFNPIGLDALDDQSVEAAGDGKTNSEKSDGLVPTTPKNKKKGLLNKVWRKSKGTTSEQVTDPEEMIQDEDLVRTEFGGSDECPDTPSSRTASPVLDFESLGAFNTGLVVTAKDLRPNRPMTSRRQHVSSQSHAEKKPSRSEDRKMRRSEDRRTTSDARHDTDKKRGKTGEPRRKRRDERRPSFGHESANVSDVESSGNFDDY